MKSTTEIGVCNGHRYKLIHDKLINQMAGESKQWLWFLWIGDLYIGDFPTKTKALNYIKTY